MWYFGKRTQSHGNFQASKAGLILEKLSDAASDTMKEPQNHITSSPDVREVGSVMLGRMAQNGCRQRLSLMRLQSMLRLHEAKTRAFRG